MTRNELYSEVGNLPPPGASNEQTSFHSDPSCTVGYEWDLTTDRVVWSTGLSGMGAFANAEAFATGLDYAGYLAPGSPSNRYEAVMAPGLDTGGGVPFQVIYGLIPNSRSAAPPVWVEDSGRWFAGQNGRPARATGSVRVVTARYEAERAKLLAAQLDGVTGAFNAAHFHAQVALQLTRSIRKHTAFAVVAMGFSATAAGRRVTDPAVLQAVMAAAVASIAPRMRASEILARHKDYGLVILFENCNGEQMALAAARLLEAANGASVMSPAGPVSARFHAGGVIAPLHGRTPENIIGFADEALAIARDEPCGEAATPPVFVRYEPEAARNAAKRRLLSATDAIVSALNEGRVVLALQPVVEAKTHAVAFYECLVRIRALDGTLIMPDVLVPAAEQGGLVPLLDRRVADLAIARLTANRQLKLSVNASVMSLHDFEWQQHFYAVCTLYPDAARRLTVEITETCAIADLDATRSVLTMLKGLGIKIAIDDFGSGHSSFRNLRGLPIDYLKIDGAFARHLTKSSDDRFFVRTLIDLAKNLKIPTVAEWIEDYETARILAEWGVDYLQGHIFGKAEVDRIDAVLAEAV